MVRHGRVSLLVSWTLVAAMAVGVGIAGTGSADAAPTVVPGTYEITFVSGQGTLGSQPFTLAPACANGLDDDDDGQTDYPADSGCASATDDDEGDAVVEYEAPTFTVSIDAAGNISAPPSGVSWPGPGFVSDVVGGKSVSGHIDPATGALSLTWYFHVQMSESGVTIQIGNPLSPISLDVSSSTTGGSAFNAATRRHRRR